ncbi:MAG: MATE family efflux transporter [Clostridia bacterium]|nr:MATE family efflux transporter [Clostridia bacterium]
MKDLTKGFPAKVIFLFALPLMIGNVAQQIYNMTDSKIVSMYVGGNALAAVGATAVVVNLLTGFVNGLTQGFGIVTARHFGAENTAGVRRAVAGTMMLTGAVTAVMVVLGLVLARPVLELLKTPAHIMDDAMAYITIIIGGQVFVALYNMCANTLRALGDSKRPLYCLFAAIVINVVLDLLMCGPLHMGIRGAAVATVIAQAMAALSCLYILCKGAVLPRRDDFALQGREVRELTNFGLSMALMLSIVNIGTIILQSGINSLGTQVMIAHVSARKIVDILMVMIFTIGISMTTYVSQNYGAGKIRRIRQGVCHALAIDTVITTVLILVSFIFGRQLVGWVATSDDADILRNGERYIKIAVVCFYALGPLFIFRCTLQGMGAKIIPLVTSVLEMTVKVLSVMFLVPWLGYLGVCLTEPISWIAMTTVLTFGIISTMRKVERRFAHVEARE